MERIGIIAAAAILVALLIAAVAVATLRGDAELDAGSPEAAVQRYLRALADRDFNAAYDLWAPEVQERCDIEDIAVGGRYDYELDTLAESRITLDGVDAVGEVANVRVSAAETRGGGLFGPSEYTRNMTFSTRQYDEEWLIVHHRDPWFECVSEREDAP